MRKMGRNSMTKGLPRENSGAFPVGRGRAAEWTGGRRETAARDMNLARTREANA